VHRELPLRIKQLTVTRRVSIATPTFSVDVQTSSNTCGQQSITMISKCKPCAWNSQQVQRNRELDRIPFLRSIQSTCVCASRKGTSNREDNF